MTTPESSHPIGAFFLELDTPSLLLDLDLLKTNIAKMTQFMEGQPCDLRPHSKTHKCPTIAKMQIESGAIGICCQKLGEAEIMAEHGIMDILITNQIVGDAKVSRLMKLLDIAPDVKVAVDNQMNIEILAKAAKLNRKLLHVLIEVDVGMKRCGVRTYEQALQLAKLIDDSPHLNLAGLIGYEGHCVNIQSFEERKGRTHEALSLLLTVRDELKSAGYKAEIISAGGTGTYDITGQYPGITEIEPGSYIFMDTTYRRVIKDFEHSLSVLATVTSTPSNDRFVLDCGVKTLVGDFGTPEIPEIGSAKNLRLSEEHSIWSYDGSIDSIAIGRKVRVIPGHCCSTVNMHDHYHVIEDDRVVGIWEIAAARRAQ